MEFAEKAGISATTMAKLSKNEYVSMEVLVKMCRTLECTLDGILDILPEDNQKIINFKCFKLWSRVK